MLQVDKKWPVSNEEQGGVMPDVLYYWRLI